MNPANVENPDIFPQVYDGIEISDSQARNLTDWFALAWIFFTVLAIGLLMLEVNLLTSLMGLFSMMLGGIWWVLSHFRRRKTR